MGDLRISVHFLQRTFHGRGEDGSPEWPPSPLRLFQAMIASGLSRGDDPASLERRERTIMALRWLERQAAPEIVAPEARIGQSFRLYVPDNVADLVANKWVAGGKGDIADYRSEKDVRPVHLDDQTLHFEFRNVDAREHFADIQRAARSMTHVGWGIDQVAGDAALDQNDTPALHQHQRWVPRGDGTTELRVPVHGSFDALQRRYEQSLRRLEGGVFRPVSPLTAFTVQRYARVGEPIDREYALFRLVAPVTSDRLSFDPARRARDVAAWIRHAVGMVCDGWPFGSIASIVHGHGEDDVDRRERFSFLPLPTIVPARAGRTSRAEGIARVLVTSPPTLARELAWVRAQLAGRDLEWKGKLTATLEALPATDWVASRYVGESTTWSTVTPVVLPGHDDRSTAKAERLLRRAFVQAGFDEAVAAAADMDWRKVGFRAGTDHAERYARPEGVTGPLFHVRVRFASPQRGPIFIGSGRHRGVGVFAIED